MCPVERWGVLPYSQKWKIVHSRFISSHRVVIGVSYYKTRKMKSWNRKTRRKDYHGYICRDLPYMITCSDEIIKAGKALMQCNI